MRRAGGVSPLILQESRARNDHPLLWLSTLDSRLWTLDSSSRRLRNPSRRLRPQRCFFAIEPQPPVSWFFTTVAVAILLVVLSFFSLRTHIQGRRVVEAVIAQPERPG